MTEHVVVDDARYGFTWYRVDGQYFLESEDGYRRVNDSVVDLLNKLARGTLTVEELRAQANGGPAVVEGSGTNPEEVLSLVETYLERGILREDEPVVRVTPPDDVRLWPRVAVFLLVLSAFGAVVAPIASSVSPALLSRLSVGQIASIAVLSAGFVAIHEYGHYAVSARHFDPSVRLDVVNGVVPAVVTDTTGSWTLPRNQRIWINLAGPLLELGAAVPLVALHYVFPNHLVVQLLLLAVFGHVVFALNPLIHGDGFWILCDYFGLRDVRQRGFEDLRALRPSWTAAYVVVSYGLGAVLVVWMTVTLAALLGLVEFHVPV
ncbi:hypothetical protein [Halorussus litoreus]|uniref:hypothetical protein n=1 Tax=Halorussus litoreus TaxID=1710536 RepID=UPI000E27D690|nr:hypothetical protein [Halorussus litoreus]